MGEEGVLWERENNESREEEREVLSHNIIDINHSRASPF